MKNPDEMVERVLAGLREVDAPVGLERRVLAAMEERAAARVGWRPMRWFVACAVAAAGIAGVMIMRPARVPGVKGAAHVVSTARVEKVQGRTLEVRADTAFRTARKDASFREVRPVRKEGAVVAERTDQGGFPAPPMPLTESEKLLLRVAHHRDATELTPLNAEARARQSAAFDAEFMEFFATPDVREDETSSPENAKGETR